MAAVDGHIDQQCLAIEQAFAHNNEVALRQISTSTPQWQALRSFRLAAMYIPAEQHGAARQVLNDGLDIVNRHLRQHPDDVEVLLLGAMLDGQYLLLNRWRLLRNGTRGLRRLKRAEALAPHNPRAALIRGTAKVVLPTLLGGNNREAISLLGAALTEQPLCYQGEWAQVDLLNWLGRAYAAAGDIAAAQAAYQRALAKDPHNHWVKLAISGQGFAWRAQQPAD